MTPERKIEILVKSQNKLIGRVGELEQQIIELNGRVSVILEVVGQHSGQLRAIDLKEKKLSEKSFCVRCNGFTLVSDMKITNVDDRGPLYACTRCIRIENIRSGKE